MIHKVRTFFSSFYLVVALFLSAASPRTPLLIPATSTIDYRLSPSQAHPGYLLDLDSKQSQTILNVTAPGIFSFGVEQQPASDPAFVSSRPATLTQFSLAIRYQTYGFLAHNTLAGNSFFQLTKNDILILEDSTHSFMYYRVISIQKFQALDPDNPYSTFIDLSDPTKVLTSTELFMLTYAKGNQVILQTCIEANGEPSWGRMFITALPLDTHFTHYLNQFSAVL